MISINEKHNSETKEFFEKLIIFIDTTLVNASASGEPESKKTLVAGFLSIKDAIFSELIRDNFANNLAVKIKDHENKKKLEKEQNQKDLNQEQVLEKDQ
jgi:hypothetical protein|tara:strand:+ start:893 stop:1189 length:297 start_codon:yes stop_codon:yes gene_type:complete